MFWIGLFLLLFTFLLWLLPIIFYQTQKGSVRDEIRRTLDNIKAEYNNQNIAVANNSADELLKLAELRDKNIITNEEFEKRKKQILES
ncbi:MAG: SHOCT domain-containing protein [Cyanobacteria bacterium]|nr:SHOCT domain-containing protein [Cyanobacteria bacterium CG_2015-16_32_12]NCO76808.1 SHOCT domain-containing protein [Cyanobacteria bacterium CG_2015-22_32_23]NCQ05067.1 SHOCT domain-containing protein [Cyanobacteria bacterium CG_2015-09_32_10]NCS85477.1 SHOCT domain-containing protein [Cyanobacteria bacterium CG_2015-02_32_10]